jgi:hypothetical protein
MTEINIPSITIDEALRGAQRDFIRSDNEYRTLTNISILEAA